MVKRSIIRLLSAWILACALLSALSARAGEPDSTDPTKNLVGVTGAQLPLAQQIRLGAGVVITTLPPP